MEARLDREGALDWAERHYRARGRWPTRRFRVEVSLVGNSLLMRAGEAGDVQKKYGGEIIELIPSPQDYKEYCAAVGRECVIGRRKTKKPGKGQP